VATGAAYRKAKGTTNLVILDSKKDKIENYLRALERKRNAPNDQPFTRLPYIIKLTNTNNLKPHEHTDPKKIHEVKKSIIEQGIKYPIVADKKTNIILDGHHRHNVFKNLKIQNIPVFYVNYMDSEIILDSWNSRKLTKQDVINKATSGKLYPIKTTKHMLKTPNGQTHISSTLPRIDIAITQLKKIWTTHQHKKITIP